MSVTSGVRTEADFGKVRRGNYSVVAAAGEKAVAPHSGTLAWKITWMEEPGSL